MSPEVREVGGGDAVSPFVGRGLAAQLVEFSQLCGAAEAGDDKFVREQLSAMENEIFRSGRDAREFRAVIATMFDRYAAMRPSARTHLERIIAGMQGADLSSAMPELGWASRLAGAAKKILSREAPGDEKSARE